MNIMLLYSFFPNWPQRKLFPTRRTPFSSKALFPFRILFQSSNKTCLIAAEKHFIIIQTKNSSILLHPAQDHLNPGQQFKHLKGLHNIIIRTQRKPHGSLCSSPSFAVMKITGSNEVSLITSKPSIPGSIIPRRIKVMTSTSSGGLKTLAPPGQITGTA